LQPGWNADYLSTSKRYTAAAARPRGSHAGHAFACGPEGGLEDREVDEARATGWTIASLGPLALRTETVAAAVLGAVRVFSAPG
jgi:16S rRNA (uracil1498-N3)-methyltransferase